MARQYAAPVFSGLPTPRQRRMYSFLIIAGMLALTSFLHFTDPGQSVYEWITDPSSRSGVSGWQEQLGGTGASAGDQSGATDTQPNTPGGGGWDFNNQGAPR